MKKMYLTTLLLALSMQSNMGELSNFKTYQKCNQPQTQTLNRPFNQTNIELNQLYQEFKPAQDGVLTINNYK